MTDRVTELLDGGDWACAWANHASLEAVCDELADLVSPDLAARARRVERFAHDDDLVHASEEWERLSVLLRDVSSHTRH